MMTYTKSEIEEAVEQCFGGDWREIRYEGDFELKLRDEVVKCEVVKAHGGEGKGDHAEVVFRINDQYFRKEGYYSSYDGYDWDGSFDCVEPYERTITEYRVI